MMKVTKLGHCCMLIEEKGARILTDPGNYSTAQNDINNIDVVLITHEHGDHLHVDSLKLILKNNPGVRIITNSAVGAILDKEDIKYSLIEDGQSDLVNGILIEGFGTSHAIIHDSLPTIKNTGYFIGDRIFYPGDSFYNPNRSVDILALPVAGPWLKISEAIEYAKQISPKMCFPIHDGMLEEDRIGAAHKLPDIILNSLGIKFVVIKEGESQEF